MEKIIFIVIRAAVKAASPALRNVLEGFFNQMKKAASETPNEWDDLLVEILGSLLAFED